MANGSIVFNVALGKVAYYVQNVIGRGAGKMCLELIPLEETGLEDDSILRTYDTLAALLNGPVQESTSAGRIKVTTGLTIDVNDTLNQTVCKSLDQTWTGKTGNQVAAFLWTYRPDENTQNDAVAIPLTKHARLWKPDGTPFTLSGPQGFYISTAV